MKRYFQGFTLIELIVVIIIFSILISVALPFALGFIERSRGGSAYPIIDAIKKVQEANFVATGNYLNDFTVKPDGSLAGSSGKEAYDIVIAEVPEALSDPHWRFQCPGYKDATYSVEAVRYNGDDWHKNGGRITLKFLQDNGSYTYSYNPPGGY